MATVPEKVEISEQRDGGTSTFEELGVLGVDGRNMTGPRRFELPTDAFVRKTGMKDRSPPGFEHNSMDHLSISAVKPGAAG